MSLSPSHTTQRQQQVFKECTLLIPGVLREANMQSHTPHSPTYFFFRAKVVDLWQMQRWYPYEENAIAKKCNSKKRHCRYSAAFPAEGRLDLPPDAATTWTRRLQLEHFIDAALRDTWISKYGMQQFPNTDGSLSAQKKNKLKSPVHFPVWYKLIQMA